MEWLILVIVVLAVLFLDLYDHHQIMKTVNSIGHRVCDIQAKLDKLLPRKMRGAKADVVILDELLEDEDAKS